MILIERNKVNTVALTLTERVLVTLPFFLFVFETDGDTEDDSIKWTGTNEASPEQKERFDLFSIEEDDNGSDIGAINGPIKLSKGQYAYKVYESEVETLDIALTTGRILEEGMAIVFEKGDEEETYNDVYA